MELHTQLMFSICYSSVNQRWKYKEEKARKFEKLNCEMSEEKKRILPEFTKFRNRVDDDTSL